VFISGFSVRVKMVQTTVLFQDRYLVIEIATDPLPGWRVSSKRGMPSAKCVEQTSKTEEIRPMVDGFAASLLRRHVLRRSGDDAALRKTGLVGCLRESEVGNQLVGDIKVGTRSVAPKGLTSTRDTNPATVETQSLSCSAV
jgi:hypothetical protein